MRETALAITRMDSEAQRIGQDHIREAQRRMQIEEAKSGCRKAEQQTAKDSMGRGAAPKDKEAERADAA